MTVGCIACSIIELWSRTPAAVVREEVVDLLVVVGREVVGVSAMKRSSAVFLKGKSGSS